MPEHVRLISSFQSVINNTALKVTVSGLLHPLFGFFSAVEAHEVGDIVQ
jgi:hypothetical protein